MALGVEREVPDDAVEVGVEEVLVVRGQRDEALHGGLWRTCRDGLELSLDRFSLHHPTIEQHLAIAMVDSQRADGVIRTLDALHVVLDREQRDAEIAELASGEKHSVIVGDCQVCGSNRVHVRDVSILALRTGNRERNRRIALIANNRNIVARHRLHIQ